VKPPATTATVREWAAFCLRAGIQVIPVPYEDKSPDLKGWPDLRLTADTMPNYFNGAPQNVGLLWGSASGGAIDADLDSPEAVALAARFLPPTPCIFGRASTGPSHRVYRSDPPVPSLEFEDVDKGPDGKRSMLLELRGERLQTIGPGSVHPSGERITFLSDDFTVPTVDAGALVQAARHLAIAVILARHWPAEGSRHHAALAAAGLLLAAGVPLEDVMAIVSAAAQTARDPEAAARRADVMTTYDKIQDGAPVVGGPELAKVLAGDGAAVVKRIKQWLGLHRSADPAWRPPADRPQVDTGNLGLAEMSAAAWDAIELANVPPKLYRYATTLAWLIQDPAGRPQIEVLGLDHVRHHLAQVATFIRWTAAPGRAPAIKPTFPPKALAADLLAVPRDTLPRIRRLVRAPIFTAEGRLLTTSGFDASSGIYVALPVDLTLGAIPPAPTAQEITAARDQLVDELLKDFPFAAAADRAHALALLLTLLLRECIPGDVPLFIVSKSTPRTGAGLLVKVLSLIVDGTPVAPKTISPEEEEMRKRLTAFLLASPSLILLDNLHGRLDSAALAAILTCGGDWSDRILGRTQEITVPVRAAFVVTGNNPALSHEMAGRTVLTRLDARMEDPSTRTGFRHPDLEAWVRAERGPLLAAGLTLAQAWFAKGRPRASGVAFGGFQAWAEILGGVLEVAGILGFLDNRRQLFDQADEENIIIKAFLMDWQGRYGTLPVATKELLEIAKTHPLDITAKTDQGMLVRLGRLIGRLVDRWFTLEGGKGTTTVAVKRIGDKPGGVAWHLASREDREDREDCTRQRTREYAGRDGGGEHPPDPPYPPNTIEPDWVTGAAR
jgi:hypothetical protein